MTCLLLLEHTRALADGTNSSPDSFPQVTASPGIFRRAQLRSTPVLKSWFSTVLCFDYSLDFHSAGLQPGGLGSVANPLFFTPFAADSLSGK
jgi:hypothetical protein